MWPNAQNMKMFLGNAVFIVSVIFLSESFPNYPRGIVWVSAEDKSVTMSWIPEVFTTIENNNHADGDDNSDDDNNENNVLNNFEKFSLQSRAN